MEPNLALYRRYRPESFAEMIGQDHVTEPLRAALANNRVNHAYLFSGPRGCGKTTSARILARTLNCEKAPVADPCGDCRSCTDLARGGPGSVDVIEIDAASHGGVDDARDLRERAFFAPVSSRYKVYIIDEAHMVTAQGFNALLKLVEEPPEHLKFVFATTEPDKVLPTIRSRTHHYPFRLFPPKLVADYVAGLCERESVAVEPAVLPLVARAGAGSMRDSLSVMDQLISGAGPDGVTYDVAANLLGYTPDNLLDDTVDAFAAADGAAVFGVIDKVIESGQDPRRFTEDLLRRLRDLVIVAAVPDAPASGLLDVPDDQAERLTAQAARFGKAELVRAADAVATGLTEMRGATTPRLLLELICARVLLPGVDHDVTGLTARLDRLERRLDVAPPPVDPAPISRDPAPMQRESAQISRDPAPMQREAAQTSAGSAETRAGSADIRAGSADIRAGSADTSAGSGLGLADVRRLWPSLLDRVKGMRRFTWILLSQNAHVVGVDADTLTIGFKNAGARDSFLGGGSDEILRQAAIAEVGADWRIEAIVDQSAGPEPPAMSTPTSSPEPRPPAPKSPDGRVPEAGATGPPAWATEDTETPSPSDAVARARERIGAGRDEDSPGSDPDADVDPDDVDADDNGIDTNELLSRELGATVIEEIKHD